MSPSIRSSVLKKAGRLGCNPGIRGKKKRHTLKSQIIADVETRLIYDVDEAVGSVHGFKLCKESLLLLYVLSVMILADSGYQGIQEYHACSVIPIKKSKNRELNDEEKHLTANYPVAESRLRISTPRSRSSKSCRIGGSDASAILGKNPWKYNTELFDEKTGVIEAPDIRNNDAVQYGIDAEESLRTLFALDYPQYDVIHEEYKIYRNSEYPFMLGTFDGILIDRQTGERGILEIKTTEILKSMMFERWDGQVPQNYFIQVMHYLLVSGFSYAFLVAQLKSNWKGEFRKTTKHYYFNRVDHEADIEFLKSEEINFWQNHILKNKRPDLISPKRKGR